MADQQEKTDGLAIIAFSSEFDRIFAVMNLASGALAMGQPVALFFTFWGTSFLRKRHPELSGKKTFLQSMFGWMMPKGSKQLPLSHFNFLGIGPRLLRKNLSDQNQPGVEEMWQSVLDLGAEIYICSATMEIMGISKEEFMDIPNVKYCGSVKFLEIAQTRKTAFFI